MKYLIFILFVSSSYCLAQELDSLKSAFQEQTGVEKVRTGQRLSSRLRRSGDYSESLKYAHSCLELSQQLSAEALIGESYNLIGLVYEETEKKDLANEFLYKALDHFKLANYSSGEANAYINLALVADDPKEQVRLTLAAIEPNSKTSDTSQLLLIYSNLSYHYFLDQDYSNSIDAANKGLEIIDSSPNPERWNQRKGQILVNLCENLVELERNSEALGYLDVIRTNEHLLNLTEKADLYRMYMTVYKNMGKYEKALESFQMEKFYRDSVFQLKTNEEVMKSTIKAEKKVLEQRNELLNKENTIADLELKRQKLNNYIFGIAALLLLIVLVVIGYSYQTLRSKNKKLVATNQELVNVRTQHVQERKNLKKEKVDDELVEENPTQEAMINDLSNKLKILLDEEEIYIQSGLTMDHLVKKLNTNRTYLSMAVNRINPSGFVDMINQLRVMKSCELLADPKYSSYTIQYIANEVGFNSQPSFNQAFKKFTGVTPSFYLKELRKLEKV